MTTVAVYDRVTQAIQQRLLGNVEAVDIVLPDQLPNYSPRHLSVVISPGDPTPNEENSFQGNPPAIAFDV